VAGVDGYPASVPEEELGPLPAGRHGLSREQVAHNQRERLIAAFAHAVAEHGYHDTTIAHITKAASVSRRVFYENFEGKEECFIAAFDIILAHQHELMDEAGRKASDWPHQVVAELAALLRFYASEPELARLNLVEALAAGPAIAERYREALLSFAPRLEPGRALRSTERRLPESREGSLLGGLASLLSRQVASGHAEQLPDLLPDLIEFLLTPYVGPDEAERLAAEVA
jgi:AcrR family transcriptional regulator